MRQLLTSLKLITIITLFLMLAYPGTISAQEDKISTPKCYKLIWWQNVWCNIRVSFKNLPISYVTEEPLHSEETSPQQPIVPPRPNQAFDNTVNYYCNDPKILEVLQKTCKEASYKLCNPEESGYIDIGCIADIKLRTEKENANSTVVSNQEAVSLDQVDKSGNPRDPAYTSLGPELFEGLLGYLCDSTYWGENISKACENHTLSRCVKDETRDDFEGCVRARFNRTPHQSLAEAQKEAVALRGSPTAPTGATSKAPVVPPPALVGKVSDEYISALGAWCNVQCGEDKKATCMDSVGFACEKQADFRKCIEDEAKKFCQAAPAPAQPPAPLAAQPAAPPGPAPVITVQALINGLQKADLFTPVGKVTFSAKITANNNSSCVKIPTSFELSQTQKNELITLPISNTTSCEGYSIDLDELKLAPGEYELTVKPNNQSPAKATFSLKRGSTTTTQASVFSCKTKAEVTGTTIRSSVEGTHPSYDRINWYIGKESVAFKGTNKPGDLTEFKDLEPNTTYQIQAEYYSQDVSSKREAFKCVPAVGVKTSSSAQDRRVQKFSKKTLAQVLGETTSPISFDILPSVSPSSIVAINVRVVALDKNGQEADLLYDGIWENGRPLPITVNNPSQVSAVKVTVSMVDETNQFSPSTDTSYIPISSSEDQIDQTRQDVPQSFYLLTSPDLEVLEQSIRNGQGAITLIASSEHPVSHPSFSVNGARVAPDSTLCAKGQLGPCGYHLTLYAPFVGDYSISFEDKTVQFSAPEALSEVSQKEQSTKQEGGGLATDLTKITISKEDGTDPQVIYENGQSNPAEFANLLEGDNRLIVTKLYSNGETKTDYLVVRRKTQTEEQKPAEEEPTQQPPIEETTIEEPSKVAPPPQQSTFSHRTCGDVSGNVIVDVYSDGSETAGTNCEDLGQVCTLFDSEGRQDATCVDKQETE